MNEQEYALTGQAPDYEAIGAREYRRLSTAKWLVTGTLVLQLLYNLVIAFYGNVIFQSGNMDILAGSYRIITVALWLAASLQLYRIPLDTYRKGAILLAVFAVYNFAAYALLDSSVNNLLINSVYRGCATAFLSIPAVLILSAGLLCFCWRGGANLSAAAFIVALNIFGTGISFAMMLPLHAIGSPVFEISYLWWLLQAGYIWGWWMFLKYSFPDNESADIEPLNVGKVLLHRIFIGIIVIFAMMIAALPQIARLTLNN